MLFLALELARKEWKLAFRQRWEVARYLDCFTENAYPKIVLLLF